MYKATIGVDFALKTLQWNKSTTIQMQLWDIGAVSLLTFVMFSHKLVSWSRTIWKHDSSLL